MIPKNRITNIFLFVILTSLLPLFGFGQQDASIGNQIKTSIKEPHGTISITYDNGNNFWCLTKGGEIGYNLLMVLPSEGAAWEQEELSGVDLELWHTVLADEQGILWLASSEKLVFADLRNLSRGWTDIRAITDFPTGDITALITGSNGSALVGLVSGNLVETKLKKITEGEESYYIPSILVHKIPIGLMALNIDKEGNVDCKTEKETVTMDLGSSWMENWEMVAHMPGSNHDLRGDVLNDRFYMAGGLTAEYGYPMQSHAYSELFEFDAEENKWRVVADLGHQRIYCATGVLKGNLWVVGGDIIHLQGKRTTTRLSQKVDPKKGEVENTIPLNVDLSAPLAFNLQERLYVLGYKNGLGDKEMPLYVASIADGDKQWREEPLGPLGRGAIYGSLHQGRISIVVANKYLAMLDPVKGKWDTVELPLKVRSPQVASLHDELWLMGGRDIENQALVQVYNTKNKQWRNGPDLPRELAWGVGFTLKGNLYVTGGAAGSSYNNRTFRLKRK